MEGKKKFLGNTIYSMGGMMVMQLVLQILIYPLINRIKGPEFSGDVLYLMGYVNILGPSIGQALNTNRLVTRRVFDVRNGEYNLLVLILGAIGASICLLLTHKSINGLGSGLLFFVLMLITVERYYAEVEFRLSLNYKGYFIYYVLVAVGYLAGFGLYMLTDQWLLIFAVGECAALIYVYIIGGVYRPFMEIGPNPKKVFRNGTILVMSYLITNCALYLDRMILMNLVDGTAVTEYNAASLMGKTLLLVVAPINTVVISYLTKSEKNLNRKQFLKAVGAALILSAVFFAACQIGAPIFIRLMYPGQWAAVQPIIWMINIGQILSIASAFLFMVVLSFTSEQWQLLLQVLHIIVFTAIAIPMTKQGGMRGFAIAAMIANGLRILLVILLGIVKSQGKTIGTGDNNCTREEL